jgi:hypothetical protein
MLLKDLFQPEYTKLIICPSIITKANQPIRVDILIPLRLMDLAGEDDHGGKTPSRDINAFNNSNLFAIPWLYSSYAACSMTGYSNNLYCIGHTHLEASFIKIIDILLGYTIFYYGIPNQTEPLTDNLWILTFGMLVVIFASIF